MSVKLHLMTPLARIMGGKEEVELEAKSVGEALSRLWEIWPEMRGKLGDDEGRLKRFVSVYVNGEEVRREGREERELHEGDEVSLMLAITGGRE